VIDETYYLVRELNVKSSPDVKRIFSIAKFTGANEPSETGTVREFHNGRWDSDDMGFTMKGKESKRIRIVRKHIELGEPVLTAYWQNSKNEIEYTHMGTGTSLDELQKMVG
jgi:hypothetical protein